LMQLLQLHQVLVKKLKLAYLVLYSKL
jgi:hypothetical protein